MSNKEAGKGSRPRPKSVRAEEFSSRWEATFGKQHGNKQEDNHTGKTGEGQEDKRHLKKGANPQS